ncbi:hypothetical protein [Prochlorothrix hollandica]|nr:hypothetical protein [Prochlorothrix hollandica]
MTLKRTWASVLLAIVSQTPKSRERVRYALDVSVSLHQALILQFVIKRTF